MLGVKPKKSPRFGMGRVYLDATAEALLRGDRRVGTEHLVLALLQSPDSITARALQVELTSARAALQVLDRVALSSVGIDAVFNGRVFPGKAGDRLPLTPAAREVFTGLRKEAGDDRLGVQHVLLALLSRQRPDPAADLLDALEVDRATVRARVRGT
ncbi:MAG: Clp protease N-terminal domain-containing protein [Nocardioides sp.]|uniref:Clp protease N-terminal domain-containing protein n=1 Tax=Nocardioides sp. TaxID=35761 RepID=UPI00326633A5